jgi:hypothetical protein
MILQQLSGKKQQLRSYVHANARPEVTHIAKNKNARLADRAF